MAKVNEKLNSITFIKETFPDLFKIAKNYYCDKSLYTNYKFTQNPSQKFLLNNYIDLNVTINHVNADYYQGNFYKITLDDLEILKKDYYNELNNTQVNNKLNSLEMLQITSTIDTYLLRMEDLLCKPHLKRINE